MYRLQGNALLLAAALVVAGSALAQEKPLAGVTLTIASQNDQYAVPMAELSKQFSERTGAEIKVDILDYGSLLTKTTADFIGNTGGYDIVTMDNVWSGQYGANGYTVDLTDWIARDADEIMLGDIYPVVMQSLGGYNDMQIAFPFAAYANVLAVRKDLLDAAGLGIPGTVEELIAAAYALTDADSGQYGFVANGQKGPAVAQDWMQYNSQMGGSVLDAEGMPALNSDANVESLTVYRDLFLNAAPPGAADYHWGNREESFRQGVSALMQTWSVGAPGYWNPEISNVVGKVEIVAAPRTEGLPKAYGVGGWGLAINKDVSEAEQEAAWEFIKWITSPEIQIELNLRGAGGYLRKSTLAEPVLLEKFPFLPVLAETFEHGNGEFRPRIPQYPEIQDLLGTAVNAVLVGDADPRAALDKAQAGAEKLF